jgi:hypothetical protein
MAVYAPLKRAPEQRKNGDSNGTNAWVVDIDYAEVEAQAEFRSSPNRRSTGQSVDDLPIENAELLDLDEDVYGAVFFSLTFDVSELVSKGLDKDGLDVMVNLYRLVFTMMLLCANYVLQIALIYWVYLYVASPSVHHAQDIYRRYHAEVFMNGEFQKDLWHRWEAQDELCAIAFSKYWFLYAILCLWWIAMLTEVRNILMLQSKICALPRAETADQIVFYICESGDRQGQHLVWQLTTTIRIVLYSCVVLPKLAIAVGLWCVGTLWIAATDSFENLVLNSVALTFVTQVDELMFNGLIPHTMKKNISITKLVRSADVEDKAHEALVKAAYRAATVQVAIVLCGVAVYMSPIGQSLPLVGIFPGYASDQVIACRDLWTRQRLRLCERGKECFPIS